MDFTKITQGAKRLFSGDGKIKLIVALGLLGMLLILLSQFADSGGAGSTKNTPSETQGAQYLDDTYALQLEERLQSLISSIEGVGETRVMVTLEHGAEYIYAQEEKSSTDKTTSETGGTDYRHDSETSYVFVDAGYGEKQPLIRTQTPPKVLGVVVVCQGAGDILVQDKVTNVVTTALHIPTTRVCVVKIHAD